MQLKYFMSVMQTIYQKYVLEYKLDTEKIKIPRNKNTLMIRRAKVANWFIQHSKTIANLTYEQNWWRVKENPTAILF